VIKIKLKLCSGCGIPKQIWKNIGGEKFCRECIGKSKTGVAKEPKPTAKRIPFRSSKKEKLDAIYSISRVKFLNDHPMCHAHIDAHCTKFATEVHHKKGRIAEYYLDQLFWLPTCHWCHVWITNHPQEAIEMGLSLPRLSNDKTES
jgi:hypothetical protein